MRYFICDCGGSQCLSKEDHTVVLKNKEYTYKNCVILRCSICQKKTIPKVTQELLDKCAIAIDESVPFVHNFYSIKEYFKDKKQKDYIDKNKDVKFIYDKDDYYFFTGLWRRWNTGFLTPVFFNKEVLLKYKDNPKYTLKLSSDTCGTISKKLELESEYSEFVINFGVNSNNKVFMWLGDILELFIEEQYYLRAENVNSDHNIASDFYDQQIQAERGTLSLINRVIDKRKNLNEKIKELYSFSLTDLEEESTKIGEKILIPIVNTKEAFKEQIELTYNFFAESLNSKELKRELIKYCDKKELENLKGIKLFEKFLEKKVRNGINFLNPLFVLNDLRQFSSHLKTREEIEKIMSSSCERLGLESENRNYVKIYETLYKRLEEMYDNILKSLKHVTKPIPFFTL